METEREIRVGASGAGGGGESCYSYCPPTQKPTKIGPISKNAWHFGLEDLVKTKFIIIYCKKNMDRAFKIFLKI